MKFIIVFSSYVIMIIHGIIYKWIVVQYSVMSDCLQPHRPQHAKLLCPWLSPRVCSNSCPLSWWCHLTISSSATLFSSCPQSFLASESFPMSQLFTLSGQKIGASSSATVLTMNIHWLVSFRIDWFDAFVHFPSLSGKCTLSSLTFRYIQYALNLSCECMFPGSLSHHNKDLERQILKPSACHSSRVLDKPCYSS